MGSVLVTVEPSLTMASLPTLLLLTVLATARAQNSVAGLAAAVDANAASVAALQTRMAGLQRTTQGAALAPVLAVDATLSSGTTKCGPQLITGWTENYDYYFTTAVQATSQFDPSSGIFTAPILGYYKICSSARFQKGGNSVDMTLLKGGGVIAAYGNALQTDWRTTGVCTIQLLAIGDQISLRLQSGGSSDCVQETSYLYSRLSIHFISCSTATCT